MASHPMSALCLVSEAAETLNLSTQAVNWFLSRGYLRGAGRRVARQSIVDFTSLWHREWPDNTTPNGYIYLMRYSYLYKIGLSKDVHQRQKNMTASLPGRVQVHLIHTIPTNNMRAAETKLHTFFAKRRAEGEWFNLGPKEIDLICQCRALIV